MRHRFQDEVRGALVKYALVPVFVLAVVGSVLMLLSWKHYVTDANHEQREMVTDVMHGIFSDYWRRTEQAVATLSAEADLREWQVNPGKRAEIYQYLYHEVNIAHDGTQFYLVDTQGNILLGSQETLPMAMQPFHQEWGILHRMSEGKGEPVVEFVSRGDTGRHDLLIGQAVVYQGQLEGWFFFLIPGGYLENNIVSGNTDFILADSFGNAQIVTGAAGAVRMGKVTEPFVSAENGLVQVRNREYYVTSESVPPVESVQGYRVYAISPVTDLLLRYALGAGILLGIVLIMVPIILVSARRESLARSQAVNDLVDAFAAVKEGRLNNQLEVHAGSDLAIIEEEYNRMTESLQKLIRQNEEETRASVISEVRQLESQFNPHFLFNTLENIKFMVKMDSEAAMKMIHALSALLRYSLHEETRRVKLAKDIEYLHSYMEIQQYRFGERLHYSEFIDEAVRNCLIPKLLFQPVLENAIKYGEDDDGRIEVRLSVTVMEEDLLVIVEDKGLGMSKTVFDHLQQLLREGENNTVHKGVYNVHRRIQLMFGMDYGVKLSQPPAGGMRVEMRLPRQEGDHVKTLYR
ncbi:two-component system, sensor histidine kinase YesM [Selenomonas sp. WCT3]|uniref:sensor histidine kinase n=1 Tax=Selenomonas sp. WCT3 TaxID=3158785 RepID=UPI0008866F9D|nr:two-component system, sensor histidine kinase YesM [Selenomonas ruminantium]